MTWPFTRRRRLEPTFTEQVESATSDIAVRYRIECPCELAWIRLAVRETLADLLLGR